MPDHDDDTHHIPSAGPIGADRPIGLFMFLWLSVLATRGFTPFPRRTKVASILLVAAIAVVSRVTRLTTHEVGILLLLVGSPAYSAILLRPMQQDVAAWQRSRQFGTLMCGGLPAMAFMHWGTLAATESLRLAGGPVAAITVVQLCGVAAGLLLCHLGLLLVERMNAPTIILPFLLMLAPLLFFLSGHAPWQTCLVWSLYVPAELVRLVWHGRLATLAERRSNAPPLPSTSNAVKELQGLIETPGAKQKLFAPAPPGSRQPTSLASFPPAALAGLALAMAGTLSTADSNQTTLALGLGLLLVAFVHRTVLIPRWVSAACVVGMVLFSFLGPLREALELSTTWAVRVGWPIEQYAFALTLMWAVWSMFAALGRTSRTASTTNGEA